MLNAVASKSLQKRHLSTTVAATFTKGGPCRELRDREYSYVLLRKRILCSRCNRGRRADDIKGAASGSTTGQSRAAHLVDFAQRFDAHIKNEAPKKARGDRRQEWRIHCQIPHTETKPYLRNAAVPRRFERHSLIDAQRPNSLAGAAGFESLHQGSRPGSRPHPPSAWSRAASRSRSRGCGSPRRGGGRSKGPGDDADLRHRHATSTVRLTICLGPWALKVVHPENHIRT